MTREQMKELIKDKVKYYINITPCDIQIKGNCSAIDEEVDKENEKWILDQLESGNEWAWCDVEVKAEIETDNNIYVGTDHLGACSYLDEASFCGCGYFEDMKAGALENLIIDILNSAKSLESLGVVCLK